MRRFVSFLIAALAFPLCCLAQDASTGAIQGIVLDPSNSRIAGATVALVNDATGLHYEQTTDSVGRFAFELLPPGEYSARVTADGMPPQLSQNLRVNVGPAAEIEFKLAIAGARESVTVSAEPRLAETQPRGLTAVIDERAILSLPLNGRRFTDLALLTPGVTQDPRGQNSTSNGDLAFGGIRGFQTSYLVDGTDNNNAFFAQARGRYRAPYQFSNEVVQEFRVSPNSVSAESGRIGGAVVNVVTKSGSNKFHGTGFYYLRDSVFDAADPTLNIKPSNTQHQFGFTVGGPLRRNSREHREHLAETTFKPLIGGLELTPLRAYAHQVPHYYVQRLGPAVSQPDSNEYAAFAQDTIRVSDHLGLSLGVRYDVQTFATRYLKATRSSRIQARSHSISAISRRAPVFPTLSATSAQWLHASDMDCSTRAFRKSITRPLKLRTASPPIRFS